MRKRALTEYELGFIEAMIDGEGTICLARNFCKTHIAIFRPEVSIFNTNLAILNKIKKFTGRGNIIIFKSELYTHGVSYTLRFSPNDIRWLLPQLKLVIKEHKRKIMLRVLKVLTLRKQYCRWRKEYKLKELNMLYKLFYKK